MEQVLIDSRTDGKRKFYGVRIETGRQSGPRQRWGAIHGAQGGERQKRYGLTGAGAPRARLNSWYASAPSESATMIFIG